ncbi:MAG: hypothetical protein WKG03_14030 [Telluria sp.]
MNMPPVVVPRNPDVQFAPPPAFSEVAGGNGKVAAQGTEKVECEVR